MREAVGIDQPVSPVMAAVTTCWVVSPRWISGADADHRAQALDARRAYFQQHPEHTDREWLLHWYPQAVAVDLGNGPQVRRLSGDGGPQTLELYPHVTDTVTLSILAAVLRDLDSAEIAQLEAWLAAEVGDRAA